mgnify:CR=1 FL=1
MIPALWTELPMTAEEAARWTTPEERAEAAAFASERRRAEFLSWRAIVRRELGADVQIAYDELGAPILIDRPIHISVSHCADRIAVCASLNRCAVDIEPETRDFSRAESRYLTPEEKALSDDPFWPGIVWCAKEALYKYSGRRELDFRRDLHIIGFAAGILTGRIENGEPIGLSVRREDGFILVCIL